MEEPSVLDYLKSIFDFRSKDKIKNPFEDTPNEEEIKFEGISSEESFDKLYSAASLAVELTDAGEEKMVTKSGAKILSVSWRILASLFLAILGQILLEPPQPNTGTALVLFGFSLAFLIWSVFTDRFEVISLPINDDRVLSIQADWLYFGFSLVGSIITFLAFGGHKFSFINLFLWFLTLVLGLKAFWIKESEWKVGNSLKKVWAFVKDPIVNFRITPWSVLVILSLVLVVFFRYGQLNQIPGEMFSDHAEKLLDVQDVLSGNYWTYFPRNTGREFLQMYITAFIAKFIGTGLSFISLKLGTATIGFLTLIYIYLLGKEVGNKWVGLLAFLMAGIAYWPNVISRVGLRFPLYPLFVAPTLFYLLRGLRTSKRNDFILSGIALGLGLHGYSSTRFLPFVVTGAIILYIMHAQSRKNRAQVIFAWLLLAFFALIVFLPLFRYWFDDPAMFAYRSLTRMGTVERDYPGPVLIIFLQNLWDSLIMFFTNNGDIWVHSVPNRPALDVISAVLFFIGCFSLVVRYIKKRNWIDLFLLVSIPLLMMPSILSLAFPEENPSLNRSGGAIIPVFIIVATALEGILSAIWKKAENKRGKVFAVLLGVLLISVSIYQNYDLVFNQYKEQFYAGSWNTSEIGAVIHSFSEITGDTETAYVVPYPYWVDTRLVGINAGVPIKDFALWPDSFSVTLAIDEPKLFILKPEDEDSQRLLKEMYPQGTFSLYDSEREGKDFVMFFVP